jgi:hypothetical protein
VRRVHRVHRAFKAQLALKDLKAKTELLIIKVIPE